MPFVADMTETKSTISSIDHQYNNSAPISVIKFSAEITQNELPFVLKQVEANLSLKPNNRILIVCDSRERDEAILMKLVKNSLSGELNQEGFAEWRQGVLAYWNQWLGEKEPPQDYLTIISNVEKALLGISLIGEASPKIIARILATAPQITTFVLYHYLAQETPNGCFLLDSKLFMRTGTDIFSSKGFSGGHSSDVLSTISDDTLHYSLGPSLYAEYNRMLTDFEKKLRDQYLFAQCESPFMDHEIMEYLDQKLSDKCKIIVTQGNVGSDANDNVTVFGTGGADSSAAALAVKLGAQFIEFWTHDYGMFSCQIGSEEPVPSARLLRTLSYEEAQEIAATHPSMLNPAAIKILSENEVNIHFRSMRLYSDSVDIPNSTFISSDTEVGGSTLAKGNTPQVKCVCLKMGIVLMSIDSLSMWRQVGFLAAVSNTLKKHNISVDCIATSEANITITLDMNTDSIDLKMLNDLEKDLRTLNCHVETKGPCAALSLIGKNIRSVLTALGDSLKVFEKENIHLISQASSDVNLTFILDQSHARDVALEIHKWLFTDKSNIHGSKWSHIQKEIEATEEDNQTTEALLNKNAHFWWWKNETKRRQLLKLIERENEPLYVYDPEVLEKNADTLLQLIEMGALDRVYYAMKANGYEEILKIFHNKNLGFECVSIEEVNFVLSHFPDIDRQKRILFTPNFCSKKEYEQAFALGIVVTVDNSFPLTHWGEIFRNQKIWLRVDPGKGQGHHQKVKTAGVQSKFGIPVDELPAVAQIASELNCTIVGLHAHKGSGILDDSKSWSDTALFLNGLLEQFPTVRTIDVGGGLGVPQKETDLPLDIGVLASYLQKFKQVHPNVQVVMEPGRFLVAAAGVLLARVTQIKQKENYVYIGCETGMNSLMRPTLYGAYHEIVNLTRLTEHRDYWLADICGTICESGDILGRKRNMPKTESGDVLLIAMAGAYGTCMSSGYNMRKPAKNILLQ